MADQQSLFGGDSGARLSEDGRYRYLLWRTLGFGRWLAFVMLNPSTADASADDPTIRRCMGFAKRERCDLLVANLYAYRATNPAELLSAEDPFGPRNREALGHVASAADVIVCAWGASGPDASRREPFIPAALADARCWCLGTTKAGHPRHPLYVPATQPLVEYTYRSVRADVDGKEAGRG